MFFEQAFLLAYAVTIISEVGIIVARQCPKDIQWWITGIVLGNSFTHPIVLYMLFIRNVPYIPVEVGVFFIEACWYRWAFSIKNTPTSTGMYGTFRINSR